MRGDFTGAACGAPNTVGETAHWRRCETPAPNSKGLSERLAVADHANGDPFDGEHFAPQIDFDRREVRIFRFERHRVATAAQPLHRHFVSQPRDDDLAATRLLR